MTKNVDLKSCKCCLTRDKDISKGLVVCKELDKNKGHCKNGSAMNVSLGTKTIQLSREKTS